MASPCRLSLFFAPRSAIVVGVLLLIVLPIVIIILVCVCGVAICGANRKPQVIYVQSGQGYPAANPVTMNVPTAYPVRQQAYPPNPAMMNYYSPSSATYPPSKV